MTAIKQTLRRMIFGAALVGVSSGCAHKPDAEPVMVGGVALNPDPWLEDREVLTRRAGFDLDCPAEDLSITILATGDDDLSSGKDHPSEIYWDDWAVQVGVAGCDQRIVYIRTSKGWIANSQRDRESAAPAS